jgi:hypothetical protein
LALSSKAIFFLPNYKLNNHYYTFRFFIYKYGNGTIDKYLNFIFNEKNINLVTFSNGILKIINNSQDVKEVLNLENVANSQQGLIYLFFIYKIYLWKSSSKMTFMLN